jgi:hypothetical protein
MLLAKCDEVASLKSRLEKAEKVCEAAEDDARIEYGPKLVAAMQAWAEEAKP